MATLEFDRLKAKAVRVAEEIKTKAGIDTLPYANPGPGGQRVVSLGIDQRDRLRIWPGVGEVGIHPNKKFHQAVLHAIEEPRVITRRMRTWVNGEATEAQIRNALLNRFQLEIALPGGTTYEVFNVQDHHGVAGLIKGSVTATVPGTDQAFLAGRDETANFVAMLPKVVTSVTEAHEILRPKGAKSFGTLRQGEWFLAPVTPKVQEEITRAISQGWRNPGFPKAGAVRVVPTSMALEPESSHRVAALITLPPTRKRYVTGLIWDTRKGHHQPLVLNGWYEVIRNTERVVPRQTRRWD